MNEYQNYINEEANEIELLVSAIPVGKKNAVTNYQLRELLGISDREVRRLVSIARREVCIINDQNGKGYYMPESRAEAEKWIKQETARAKSIFLGMKGARNYLKGTDE